MAQGPSVEEKEEGRCMCEGGEGEGWREEERREGRREGRKGACACGRQPLHNLGM